MKKIAATLCGIATLLTAATSPALSLDSFQINGQRLDPAVLAQGNVNAGETPYPLDPTHIQTLESSAAQGVDLAEFGAGTLATELFFLHTFQPGPGIEEWRAAAGLAHRQLRMPPEWPTVMRYEIEYADGKKIEIPVRFGEGIEQWYRVQTVAPMLWAREHWAKELNAATTEKAVFYSMQIPNPRPDQPIKALRALPSPELYKNYGTALLLNVGLGTRPLQGALYVVERQPMGDDTQPGTFEQPFGTVQHALDVMKPGDTVLVRGGLYALDARLIKSFTGEEGRWLTLSAFPGETPILDATGVHIDYRKKQNPLISGAPHDNGALHFGGDPDYTRIQGMQIRNSRFAALSVHGLDSKDDPTATDKKWGQTDHIEILFNTTFQSFSMGIISHRTNKIKVIGNRVIRPHAIQMVTDPLTGEQASHDALPQEGIDLSRTRGFEIAFNTVTGGTKEAIDCISVEDGSIHHNYIDSCLNGIYIDSWSVPIYRLDIYQNFIHNAYCGVPLATEGGSDLMDIQIHHNIVIDSKSSGIEVTEATYKAQPAKVQKHRVYNNTVDRTGDHAQSIGWLANGINVGGFRDNLNFRDVEVRDNIVTRAGGKPLKNSYATNAVAHAVVFTHNLVWPINEDLTPDWLRSSKSWRAEDMEKGADTIVKDPLYNNPARGDYRLKAGSPALGAGRDGNDLGALPGSVAWISGLDFAGTITAFYRGETVWEPLSIPRDLYTVHRNNLQRPSWFQRNRYGADFRNLPSGEQSLAGITFYIEEDDRDSRPTVLIPAGFSTESKAESILIPVGKKAAKLAFLHNAHIADRKAVGEKGQIFHYRVRYTDGSAIDIPVRAGEEIEDWLQQEIRPIKNGRIGWIQKMLSKSGKNNPHIHLYAFEWSNPKPESEIVSIEIVRDIDFMAATPAVFAISLGN